MFSLQMLIFVLKIKLTCCQKVVHDDVHYQHLLCEFR